MRLKTRPEDFEVHESISLNVQEKGQYRIYRLKKRAWNTTDAIDAIAGCSNVSARAIGYAGLKDKRAVTSQYISSPWDRPLKSPYPELELEFVGFSDDFVSSRVLEGNRFRVTLRRLSHEECRTLAARTAQIRSFGFPNYFDDQRFRGVTGRGAFLAERILKRQYKGALRLYLTEIYEWMSRAEKDRRRKIDAVWGDWAEMIGLCADPIERKIAVILSQGGNRKNLARAINSIPKEDLTMAIAAYQGMVWNKTLSGLIERLGPATFSIDTRLGEFLAFDILPECLRKDLLALKIPTVGPKMETSENVLYPHITEIIGRVLTERGVDFKAFRAHDLRAAYFKSFLRDAIVIPHDLTMGEPEPDDIHPGLSKVEVKFFLPAGSYATMLIKAALV